MTAPEGMEVGQRWKATCGDSVLVGKVTNISTSGEWAALLLAQRHSLCVDFDQWTWERLPDPERAWQPGDVVRDDEAGADFLYRRCASGRWDLFETVTTVPDSALTRPLVHLVPEGAA